jgi:hypothetical protein
MMDYVKINDTIYSMLEEIILSTQMSLDIFSAMSDDATPLHHCQCTAALNV